MDDSGAGKASPLPRRPTVYRAFRDTMRTQASLGKRREVCTAISDKAQPTATGRTRAHGCSSRGSGERGIENDRRSRCGAFVIWGDVRVSFLHS